MDNTLFERTEDMETKAATIRSAVNPATKSAWVEEQHRALFDERGLVIDGQNIAPAEIVERARAAFESKYDENMRATLASWEADLDALDHDVDAAIAVAEEVASDPALTDHAPDQTRLLVKIANSLDRAEAERKLTGKTHEEVLALYTRAPDGELARVIEEQQRGGWREVVLTNANNPTAVIALQSAVAARRGARARQAAPTAFEVKARLGNLRSNAVGWAVSRFIKHGRSLGVAGSS